MDLGNLYGEMKVACKWLSEVLLVWDFGMPLRGGVGARDWLGLFHYLLKVNLEIKYFHIIISHLKYSLQVLDKQSSWSGKSRVLLSYS